MVDMEVTTMALVWGKEVRFWSLVEKVTGMGDHLVCVIGPSTATWFTSLY
jgi:hypothetical protein